MYFFVDQVRLWLFDSFAAFDLPAHSKISLIFPQSNTKFSQMPPRLILLPLILASSLHAGAQNDSLLAIRLYRQAEKVHNNYPAYTQLAEKSLPLFKKTRQWDLYLDNLAGLRSACFFKSDFLKSEAYAQQMLAELDTIPARREWIARHFLLLTVFYYSKGAYDRIVPLCERVIKMDQEKKLDPGILNPGDAYTNIGIFYKTTGSVHEAIQNYRKALEFYSGSSFKNHAHRATVKNNLGKLYFLMKDFPESRKNYFESLQIQEKQPSNPNNDRFLGNLYLNISDYFLAAGHPDSTGIFIRKAGGIKGLRPDYYANLSLQTGLWKLADRDTAAARQFFLQALDQCHGFYRKKHLQTAKALTRLGELELAQGRPFEALNRLQRGIYHLDEIQTDSLDLCSNTTPGSKSVVLPFELVQILWLKGRALEQSGDPAGALTAYQTAGDWIWQIRSGYQSVDSKLFLGERATEIFESGIHLASRLFYETGLQEYLEAAFRFSEQSKAGLLLEAALQAEAQGLSIIPDSLFRQRNAWITEIALYEKELATGSEDAALLARLEEEKLSLELQLSALNRQLERDYPSFFAFKQQSVIQRLDRLRQWAGREGKSLAVFFWGKSQIFRFEVTGKKPGLTSRPVSPEWSEKLGLAIRGCSSPAAEPAVLYPALQSLAEDLLGGFWNDERPLVVIPDGPLNFLPFEALLTGPPSTPREMPYLLRKRSVSYAWSASALLFNPSKNKRRQTFNLFMAPGFEAGQRGLSPLRFNVEERTNFPADGSLFLEGDSANLERFLTHAPGSRWIHLSTHALAAGLPRIEFSDGALGLSQLYAMQIPAELVTLSACETGAGEFRQGEGVMSLARGFAYAGAQSLVAGLWRVNERSSANTISRFYEGLEAGYTGSEALRRAKLAWLDDRSVPEFRLTPYYWAGLVYTGKEIPGKRSGRWMIWAATGVALAVLLWRMRRRHGIYGGSR